MSTLMKEIDHDAETARLARYVAGTMSEAEVELFKTELVADEEFFDRMAPLLAVWFPREPLPAQQAEIEAMRAEASEIREGRSQRARIREHIAIAVGSLLSLKPMLGIGTLATAALVAALTIKDRQGVDTGPQRTFVHVPAETTSPPHVAVVTQRKPKPRTVVAEPQRVARLELDPAVERAVDSMVAPRLLPGVTGSVVEHDSVIAPQLPPLKRYAWYVSPADTIPIPKLDRPGIMGKVGNAIIGIIRFPITIGRAVIGRK
jgi:hypothetical protein